MSPARRAPDKDRWPNDITKRSQAKRAYKVQVEGGRLVVRTRKGTKEVGKNIHVVPNPKGWAVKPEGKPVTSTHRTQEAAIERGRQQAKQNQSELNIHGRDGAIRDKNSYGKDEYPPKG